MGKGIFCTLSEKTSPHKFPKFIDKITILWYNKLIEFFPKEDTK